MQKALNTSRIHRVHRAALEHGWYVMPLAEFKRGVWLDEGDRITYHDGEHGVYNVVLFENEQVTLRKVA